MASIISTLHEYFPIFNYNKLCFFIELIRSLGALPRSTSSFCIAMDSYLFLKNHTIFQKHKKFISLIYTSIIWGPALMTTIIGWIMLNDFDEFCLVSNKRFMYIVGTFGIILALAMMVICVVLIYKLCKIDIEESDEVLKESKKQNIKQIILYFIGNVVITILLNVFLIGMYLQKGAFAFLSVIRAVMIFVMYYIFIWNKNVKDIIMKVLCKNVSESNNSSNENEVDMLEHGDITFKE